VDPTYYQALKGGIYTPIFLESDRVSQFGSYWNCSRVHPSWFFFHQLWPFILEFITHAYRGPTRMWLIINNCACRHSTFTALRLLFWRVIPRAILPRYFFPVVAMSQGWQYSADAPVMIIKSAYKIFSQTLKHDLRPQSTTSLLLINGPLNGGTTWKI